MESAELNPELLLGEWNFERVIDDRLAGRKLQVEGRATFELRDAATIDWHERGTMQLPGGAVPVTTDRVLTCQGPGSWSVDFADGRGFHRWATGTELLHDCAPDLYRGRLDPVTVSASVSRRDPAPVVWTMIWEATGPAKNYRIETTYRFSTGV